MKKIALVAILALAGYVSADAQAPARDIKDKNPGKVNARDPHVAQPGDVRVNSPKAKRATYKTAKKVKLEHNGSAIKAKPAPRPGAQHLDKGPKKAHKKHGKAKHAHLKHNAPPVASKGCMHK